MKGVGQMCKHPKGHKFQKFDDTSLFCERCGERVVVADAAEPAPPVYVPYIYPYVPYIPPTWPYVQPNWWSPQPWPTFTVWSDTGGSSSYSTDLTMLLT
jgi:hypothetical protein